MALNLSMVQVFAFKFLCSSFCVQHGLFGERGNRRPNKSDHVLLQHRQVDRAKVV